MTSTIKVLKEKPGRVTLAGDSECVIAAVESQNASLGAYFANWVVEIQDYTKDPHKEY